ncbi:MAG: fumarylacetoacetate hydrolase family protein [Microbacterium sp.]|uniref:fumarylacetoacetate hydrolase family protein n=1 Tax=Microbacterium sp. TaxID=51671 RepID=UPI0039E691C0
MLLARCTHEGREFLGLVEGEEVQEISGDPLRVPFAQLTADPAALAAGLPRHPLAAVELLPPVVPGTFYAAGFNYKAHNRHHEELGYDPVKVGDRPEVGYRAQSALVGHGADIVKPQGVEGRFETEAEVVAVFGATLRHATREQAIDSVFGWTIGNDVSAREWQHADRTFYRAKNADTFKPMGPWIQTDVDPLASTTTVSRNGRLDAQFATGDMIFDPYDFIVEMTKYITIHPGDVLWMGADGNTPMAVGDVIDIEISGIGTLTNTVVGEAADTHTERTRS